MIGRLEELEHRIMRLAVNTMGPLEPTNLKNMLYNRGWNCMWSENDLLRNPTLFAKRNHGNGCIVLVFVLFPNTRATNAAMIIQKFNLTERQMYIFNQKNYNHENNGELQNDLQFIENNIGNIQVLTENFGPPTTSPI